MAACSATADILGKMRAWLQRSREGRSDAHQEIVRDESWLSRNSWPAEGSFERCIAACGAGALLGAARPDCLCLGSSDAGSEAMCLLL